jgi:hypothetical protein
MPAQSGTVHVNGNLQVFKSASFKASMRQKAMALRPGPENHKASSISIINSVVFESAETICSLHRAHHHRMRR